MRGIDRFLAAVLLAGAVGGVAAFARHAGSEPAPHAFHLTAAPRQHVTVPETVVEIALPARARGMARPVVRLMPPAVATATVPAHGIVVPQVTTQRPVHVADPVASATPAPEPAPAITPAPLRPVAAPAVPAPVTVPPQEAPRVLAAAVSGRHQERGQEKEKHTGKGHDAAVPVEGPGVPAPVDQAQPAPVEPAPSSESDESGDGDGHGPDHHKDHGHAAAD
jgi:hypothetical protein